MGTALVLIAFAPCKARSPSSGEAANVDTVAPQSLANFGVGVLAGYGSKDVFTWLDEKVSALFEVMKPTPDVEGEPAEVARSRIQQQKLSVGAVVPVPARTTEGEGTVLAQQPEPGALINSGQSVDMVIATSSNGGRNDEEQADEEATNP